MSEETPAAKQEELATETTVEEKHPPAPQASVTLPTGEDINKKASIKYLGDKSDLLAGKDFNAKFELSIPFSSDWGSGVYAQLYHADDDGKPGEIAGKDCWGRLHASRENGFTWKGADAPQSAGKYVFQLESDHGKTKHGFTEVIEFAENPLLNNNDDKNGSAEETKEEVRPNTASSGKSVSGGIEVVAKVTMDPELGLGMALGLSKPIAISEKRKGNLIGRKLQIYDADAIAQDPELSTLVKRKGDAVLCIVKEMVGDKTENLDDIVYSVEIMKTKATKKFKVSQMRMPGIVFVNRFSRRKDGTKGQAEQDGTICIRDQLIKVNGQKGDDLKSLVKLIKGATEVELELTFLRTTANEEKRIKDLEDDKRAAEIEKSLRVVFNKIKGDGSEHVKFVTLEQIESAGMAVYQDAAAIVLPNKPASELFKELDENGDGKVTWTEFKDFLLDGCQGVSHAARMAHYAAVFEDIAAVDEVTDTTCVTVDQVKEHVEKDNSLMRRFFPSIADQIVSKFDSLDDDHSGDLSWPEFVAGCEDFWYEKMHPTALAKAKSMQKMSFSKAKEASPENIEDQIHKPVPQHLERVVSKKTVINTEESEEANKEAEEEARKAAEQLKKDNEEAERKAQEQHKKELKMQAKKDAEEKRQELLRENERMEAEIRAKEEKKAMEATLPKGGGCCIIS
jgi:hypothetical protein